MAVNKNVTVPEGAQELYMMSYIYGFFSSGLLFALLHIIWPAQAVDRFVKNDLTPKEVQEHYERRWDIELSETKDMLPDRIGDKGTVIEMQPQKQQQLREV